MNHQKSKKKKKIKPYLKKNNKYIKCVILKKSLLFYNIYNVKFLILFL